MYTRPMALTRLLKEDIPINYDNTVQIADLYGVEVELEGKKVKTDKASVTIYWGQLNDNSLRVKGPKDEAIEYVLRQPLTYDETMVAICSLFAHLNSPNVEVYKSYRTSIHVHLSCMMETHLTIYNFMTLCIIFDELLTSQNGRHRAGNNFCLRAKDAQGLVETVIKSIEDYGSFIGMNKERRYSSVNFVSLLKYGTIEFRSLECTTDLNRLKHWIDTVSRLKKMARTYDNPQAIIRQFSLMSPIEFLHTILGPCATKYIAVKGWEIMLQQGMRLAQDLAYSANWVALKEGENPFIGKRQKTPKGLLGGEEGEGIGMQQFLNLQQDVWNPAPQVAPMPAHWNLNDEDD